jgi:hypothetical protein
VFYMKVKVLIELDVDRFTWAEGRTISDAQLSREVGAHIENVVRDLFYDQGWIAEHHPEGHSRRADCTWCQEADGPR